MRKFIVVFVYYAHFVPSSALYTESSSSWTTPIRKSCNIFTIDRMSMSIYLLFITSLTVFLLFSELVSRVCVCVVYVFAFTSASLRFVAWYQYEWIVEKSNSKIFYSIDKIIATKLKNKIIAKENRWQVQMKWIWRFLGQHKKPSCCDI